MFGLSERTIKILQDYFGTQPYICEVRVYGSRAMDTYEKGSDIDFVIFSNADYDVSGHIKTELEDLPTPYLFDVTDYNHLHHDGLKNHIDKMSKPFFKSEQSVDK